jgi:hypothetical protein
LGRRLEREEEEEDEVAGLFFLYWSFSLLLFLGFTGANEVGLLEPLLLEALSVARLFFFLLLTAPPLMGDPYEELLVLFSTTTSSSS